MSGLHLDFLNNPISVGTEHFLGSNSLEMPQSLHVDTHQTSNTASKILCQICDITVDYKIKIYTYQNVHICQSCRKCYYSVWREILEGTFPDIKKNLNKLFEVVEIFLNFLVKSNRSWTFKYCKNGHSIIDVNNSCDITFNSNIDNMIKETTRRKAYNKTCKACRFKKMLNLLKTVPKLKLKLKSSRFKNCGNQLLKINYVECEMELRPIYSNNENFFRMLLSRFKQYYEQQQVSIIEQQNKYKETYYNSEEHGLVSPNGFVSPTTPDDQIMPIIPTNINVPCVKATTPSMFSSSGNNLEQTFSSKCSTTCSSRPLSTSTCGKLIPTQTTKSTVCISNRLSKMDLISRLLLKSANANDKTKLSLDARKDSAISLIPSFNNTSINFLKAKFSYLQFNWLDLENSDICDVDTPIVEIRVLGQESMFDKLMFKFLQIATSSSNDDIRNETEMTETPTWADLSFTTIIKLSSFLQKKNNFDQSEMFREYFRLLTYQQIRLELLFSYDSNSNNNKNTSSIKNDKFYLCNNKFSFDLSLVQSQLLLNFPFNGPAYYKALSKVLKSIADWNPEVYFIVKFHCLLMASQYFYKEKYDQLEGLNGDQGIGISSSSDSSDRTSSVSVGLNTPNLEIDSGHQSSFGSSSSSSKINGYGTGHNTKSPKRDSAKLFMKNNILDKINLALPYTEMLIQQMGIEDEVLDLLNFLQLADEIHLFSLSQAVLDRVLDRRCYL